MSNKWDDPDYDEKLSDFGIGLFKWAKQMADEALAEENDSDYEVNPEQLEKFIKVVHYLQSMVHTEDGEWVHSSVDSPKTQTGRISARFVSIDIAASYADIKDGREYNKSKEFSEILSYASKFSIFPIENGEYVELEMIIPDVYVKKAENS